MTADSRKPRRAERAACLALLLAALGADGVAAAHEGHEHVAHEIAPAAAPATSLSWQSARLEAVAALDGQGLVVWIDDYASNRPLSGLAVAAQVGAATVQAQESEPGTYRVPADLLGGAPGDVVLALSVRGEGWDERFAGRLPRPPPRAAQEHGPWRRRLPAALGAAVLFGGALVLWRRRTRRAR
ncbi:hypothetical protein [Solimonas soli]|uniref:hypothetical protein n=1 Tax=Solimonas soli TaxID=413479 RepID=UPI0004803F35|nr:hypothetical protein [Solimonas soli]